MASKQVRFAKKESSDNSSEDDFNPGEPRFCSTPIPTEVPIGTLIPKISSCKEIQSVEVSDRSFEFCERRTIELMPALKLARVTSNEALKKLGDLAITVHAILDKTRISPLCVHFIEIRLQFKDLGRKINHFSFRLYRKVFGGFGCPIQRSDEEAAFLPAEIERELRYFEEKIAKICEKISCQRLNSVADELMKEGYDFGTFEYDLANPENLCMGPL